MITLIINTYLISMYLRTFMHIFQHIYIYIYLYKHTHFMKIATNHYKDPARNQPGFHGTCLPVSLT